MTPLIIEKAEVGKRDGVSFCKCNVMEMEPPGKTKTVCAKLRVKKL